ncbi:MAG: hypothetical protein LUE22_01315 [Oscillospiraceae bacterium]|nr:hypothetical protein [Oscillospiraceae bacterium]
MNQSLEQAIANAAASSAMEGLPLSAAQLQTVRRILSGSLLLEDYLNGLRTQYQDNR